MGDIRSHMSNSLASNQPQKPFSRGSFGQPQVIPGNKVSQSDLFPSPIGMPTYSQISPKNERRPADYGAPPPQLQASTSDPLQNGFDSNSQSNAIVLRKLPRSVGSDGLRSMLLFAKDLVDVGFIDSTPDDAGYATAIAQFKTHIGAREAQESLNGKFNASHDAKMIVELYNESLHATNERPGLGRGSRRSTIDGTAARCQTSSTSSNGSAGETLNRQTSRFNTTFQGVDGISSPQNIANHAGDFPVPQSSAHFQNLFSPQSPVTNSIRDRQLNLGKSVINDDSADDETDGLLRDPLAYARNGRRNQPGRGADLHVATTQFANLSMGSGAFDNSGPATAAHSAITSPVPTSARQQAPNSAYPQSAMSNFSNNNFAVSPPRTSYPPANPADQNPPCNTLYVGNLPNNTSEDELKRMFSQQRGYKRLCFRTKANGPMCFVEFESVTLATQALHHLYGKCLSNSVKGGIRLSFSKNPLGVRNGQGGMAITSPMSPQGPPPGFGNGMNPPPGFSSANGPPPGLASQGRAPSFGQSPLPDGFGSAYQNGQFGMSNDPFPSQLRSPHGPGPNSMGPLNGFIPAYTNSGIR